MALNLRTLVDWTARKRQELAGELWEQKKKLVSFKPTPKLEPATWIGKSAKSFIEKFPTEFAAYARKPYEALYRGKPDLTAIQTRLRTPYPQLRAKHLEEFKKTPYYQHPFVQQTRMAQVTPPPLLAETGVYKQRIKPFLEKREIRGVPVGKMITGMFEEYPEMKTVREKLRVGQPLTLKEKQIARKEQMFAIGDIALTVPKKPTIQEAGEDAIQRVVKALKEAKPVRKAQEVLYAKERATRLAKSLEVGKKVTGEKGFFAELGQLKGAMPKVEFESLRGKINQADIDSLFVRVKESPLLSEWDKLTAREGLSKMFGQYGGAVPTEGELALLNKTFGPEFVKTLAEKKPILQEAGYQLFNIPRSLMASFDMSAPLRQGIFLIGKPKQFFSAFAKQFEIFPSEKAFKELQEEIASRPTFNLMRENKLALTDMDSILTAREEKFMSQWAEKIPLVGRVVRASGRAYTGFLNKLRADVFDDLINQAEELGFKPKKNPILLKDLADFINTASGRGSLGAFEKAAVPLNTFFFSPRLMASRLNLFNPAYYIKLEPFVRKEALKSLFTFAGTGLTVLTLAKMGGAEVGADPRSADFGKIKIGNTRFDIWGGFQQYIKLAAQLVSGQLISSTTGRMMTLGEGYKPLTRLDILQRFFEYKESPVVSFAMDLLRGQTVIGEEMKISTEVAKRFTPMVIQDMVDLYKEEGTKGLLGAIPAWFGVGVQTYGPREGSAFYYYDKWSKMPPAEANVEAVALKKENPQLYALVKEIVTQKKLGITPEEQALSNYGVQNLERSERIWNELAKLKTDEERNDYVKKLREAKIISDTVFDQLKARRIWAELMKLKTDKERNDRVKQLRKSGELSNKVFEQLKKIKEKEGR